MAKEKARLWLPEGETLISSLVATARLAFEFWFYMESSLCLFINDKHDKNYQP